MNARRALVALALTLSSACTSTVALTSAPGEVELVNVETQLPAGVVLTDVAAAGEAGVLIIGSREPPPEGTTATGASEDLAIVLRYDGVSFAREFVPLTLERDAVASPARASLRAIAATQGGAAVLVGGVENAGDAAGRPLLALRDETGSWRELPPALLPERGAYELHDVACLDATPLDARPLDARQLDCAILARRPGATSGGNGDLVLLGLNGARVALDVDLRGSSGSGGDRSYRLGAVLRPIRANRRATLVLGSFAGGTFALAGAPDPYDPLPGPLAGAALQRGVGYCEGALFIGERLDDTPLVQLWDGRSIPREVPAPPFARGERPVDAARLGDEVLLLSQLEQAARPTEARLWRRRASGVWVQVDLPALREDWQLNALAVIDGQAVAVGQRRRGSGLAALWEPLVVRICPRTLGPSTQDAGVRPDAAAGLPSGSRCAGKFSTGAPAADPDLGVAERDGSIDSGRTETPCLSAQDCFDLPWEETCAGRFTCERERCVERCASTSCGDGRCECLIGESSRSCPADCAPGA